MKADRTNWRCDRCGKLESCELGIEPAGWWWEIHAETLGVRYYGNRRTRDLHLCSECVSVLEKWLSSPDIALVKIAS